MNLREYAKQQEQGRSEQGLNITEPQPEQQNNPIAAAQWIINEYKTNREIAEGCRLQILQDIEAKENPYKILLYAAEVISRLEFKGDTFFLQVKNKLIEVHGHDISND